jgi:hypothetical protein
MKFKDYLTETADSMAISRWFDENIYNMSDIHGQPAHGNKFFHHDRRIISAQIDKFSMQPRGANNRRFEWPFQLESRWGFSSFELDGFNDAYEVEDFKKFPAAKELHINGPTIIKSFDGIQQIKGLKTIDIWAIVDVQAKNLLALLKCPTLSAITIRVPPDRSTPAKEAIKIIAKHVETRDIAEAIDELIGAGLKEYAKL